MLRAIKHPKLALTYAILPCPRMARIVSARVTDPRFDAMAPSVVYSEAMRRILETEEHVQIPPVLYSDPFYRISYLIKEEIRKYKWFEGEKGRKLSWERARQEWTDAYREKYEKFLIDTLTFPEAPPSEEPAAKEDRVFETGTMLSKLPQRTGG